MFKYSVQFSYSKLENIYESCNNITKTKIIIGLSYYGIVFNKQ